MQPDLLGVQPLYWIWGIKKKVFQLSFLSTGSMKTFSFVSFFSLAFALCPAFSDPVFIRRNEANRVLRIQKRSNQFLEEIKSGNLERECYEETCSFEEAREIFKAQEKTTEFWFHYKDLNPCKQNPCRNGGLCQQYHYNYVCLCPPRFTGKLCDTEKLECWYNNGGCLQYCQDDDQSQDVTCSCAEGYALDENGKTCSASVVFPCGLAKSSTRSLQDDDMPLLQDDSTQPLQDDSMPSQQDDPTHTPQDDPTHSLTNNSSESILQDPTHSLQDNCTNSLQNKSTCSPKDNSTNSVQEVSMHSLDEEFMSNDTENPTGFPLTNSSFSTSMSTSFLPDNSTKTLLDNSTLLTTNSTTNASLLDLSSKNDNVQDEVRAKLLDGNLSEDNGDESVSFKESLEDNSNRIVGGTRCHLGNCPWQVLIRTFKGQDFCGGTLISSRWVVSASHCFEDVNPHHVTIGDYDKFRRDQDEQKIAVLKVYMHPHYNGNYYDNDIALLYLRSEVQFNDFAIPVCLPNPNLARMLLQEGETGVVSGWGATRFMGPSSRFLLRVTLPVVSQKKCMHSTQQVITGNMFCAGYNVEARDSCKGDSGGPFVMSYRNTWYLMGVISWGEGCAEEGKYGVYTRVSDYIHWIKQTVEGVSEADDLPRKTRRARE